MIVRPAVLAVTAVLLAGCTGGNGVPVAHDPAPTTASTPPSAPTGAPTWPACAEHVASSIDYAMGARGVASPVEAVREHAPAGTTIVKVPREPHSSLRFDVVDEHNQIVREVSVIRGEEGWLVDGVEECSGS